MLFQSSKALGQNVTSLEGQQAQQKVCKELMEKLEHIQPGVTSVLY